ncbi:MAG: helix-turn-helix domain-containing protein [Betaproteobacteria bacterium]|nr:helix-turn-helix domain-containing protein [Betaproteobacteria bacterium]
MSIRATAWAWTVQCAPTAKLVLVALADHADETGLCWPAVASLVNKTGLSERAVRSALRSLEAAAVITLGRGDGRGHTSRYVLCINGSSLKPAPDAPFTDEKGADAAPFLRTAEPERVQEMPERVHVVPERVQELPPNRKEPSRTTRDNSVRRGSRLPTDWWPSSADQDFARSLSVDPVITADSFRDYWHARPGAGGVKLDWSATWRNWCRNDAKRAPQNRQPAGKLDWIDTDPIFRRTG